MDHDAAQQRAEELKREHPDRETHTWMARGNPDGEWEVVKVRVPGGRRIDPLKATIETKPKPPMPDDPRPANIRNIPPFGAA
jgi:hypothetical protein